jgi:hypothetical protein
MMYEQQLSLGYKQDAKNVRLFGMSKRGYLPLELFVSVCLDAYAGRNG